MHLDEESVYARGHGGSRQGGHLVAVARAGEFACARSLRRVGRVEAQRREAALLCEAAEVDDEIVVSKSRSALGEEDPLTGNDTPGGRAQNRRVVVRVLE